MLTGEEYEALLDRGRVPTTSPQAYEQAHYLPSWYEAIEDCTAPSAPQHELDGSACDIDRFAFLGDRIASPFFTADVARREDGRWVLVEIGDGGVSMLPRTLDPRDLFDAMGLGG